MGDEKKLVLAPAQKRIFVWNKFPEENTISGTKWALKLLEHVDHQRVFSPNDADFIVTTDITTNDASRNEAVIQSIVDLVRIFHKPVIFLLHDDPEQPMSLKLDPKEDKILLFRTSMCRSSKQYYECLLPSFQAADSGMAHLLPATCDSPTKPKIGFCGVVRWPSRQQTCDVLKAQPDLFDTMFVYRYDHHTRMHPNEREVNRAEFVKIMTECPYQLCCRGCGNFSHRFYETLAAGRIPVLIDTDTCFAPHVPTALWKNCVVLARNAAQLPKALLDFHNTHDVHHTQIMCRNLWQMYFSFEGFALYFKQQMDQLANKV